MEKLNEINTTMKEFIASADKKYATKQEVINNTKELENLKSIIKWFSFLVFG